MAEARKRMQSCQNGVDPSSFASKRGREDSRPPSSVMKTEAGQDSFELYRSCLLPSDQSTLASMSPSKLEQIAAHDLMRVAAVTHQLALQRVKLSEKAAQFEKQRREIERRYSELKQWTDKAGKVLRNSKLELQRLARESTESFNAGRAAGFREFEESERFKAALRAARLSGAMDFKKSSTFRRILATESVSHEKVGFIKCRSQILKLGGLKPEFDLGLLDSSKDGELEPYTVYDDSGLAEIEDSEFGFLHHSSGDI